LKRREFITLLSGAVIKLPAQIDDPHGAHPPWLHCQDNTAVRAG
jgi:hypothetical protein